MAFNAQTERPGSYYIQNKSTTAAYSLRVDYIFVEIPANSQVNLRVDKNLFLPTTLLDVQITKVPDHSVNVG